MTPQTISRRSLIRGSVAGAALLAAPGTASRAAAAVPARPSLDTEALQAAISDLAHPPSVSAQLRVAKGAERWYGTAGVSDVATGRRPHPGDGFRAGSVTKVFVATVVLQLWAERRVELDAPVGRHLGDLLPAHFGRITVGQLLDHTSGLPDHEGLPDDSTPEAVLRHRFDRWTPEQWVRTIPADRPLKFRPGTKQEYRGITYVLLALLIERLTGRPYGEVIRSRVLEPLGLRHTLLPGGDPHLHGPHIHGYLRMTDGTLQDATVFNVSNCWGEGELVSTVDDLFCFQRALFSGALLPPHAMAMLFTLPPDGVRMLDGSPARYSMGLQQVTVNGLTFWGKTGEMYGYRTRVFSTRDGRVGFVLHYTPTPLTTSEEMAVRVAAVLAG
ncbi:beta-lactamase family protein [Streptomyces ferrugineus]|uniref:Beta-lactamase family protein n=1 Tax=Streptomyces ferrugineus TaxID=1413221 RepID=A0A7M2SSH3_9ACTN|nr:serine hydrolase domain-containing protein [Streptomyces ferrugineus]QOV38665.1 beta-lactamase family protein [Streptomyces ferrugineus]